MKLRGAHKEAVGVIAEFMATHDGRADFSTMYVITARELVLHLVRNGIDLCTFIDESFEDVANNKSNG